MSTISLVLGDVRGAALVLIWCEQRCIHVQIFDRIASQFWCAQAHPKSPDFKHRLKGHALWIDSWSNPPWVKTKLIAMSQDKAQHYGGANIQVPQGVAGQDSSR